MSRKLRIWLVLLIVMVIGVAVAVHLLFSGSATGTVHIGTPTDTFTQSISPLRVKTTYFSTTLPAGFSVKRHEETPGGEHTLLQLAANSSGNTSNQFAVTVGITPVDSLRSVGDYNLRTTQPAVYAQFTPPNLPAGAIAFRTTSGPVAFTVFWPRGQYYAEVSVSTDSGATLAQLQAIFTEAVSTWTWGQ